MKASISWLKSLCPTDLTVDDIVSRLTMAGLEVNSVESAANDFAKVVVGEVLSVEQHPDAEKLNVCQVTDGSATFQVVCGASNVRSGLKTPFAKIGATIGKDFRIKRVKLRGLESHGMLCGADELGLSDESDGLMELPQDAPLGMGLDVLLSLPDQIIDIDLTPNRGDCLSLTGLARELGVLSKTRLKPVLHQSVNPVTDETFPVCLQDPSGCPAYVGRVIDGVDVKCPTPVWMIERLRRSGIRSIDAIVDITNYVMIELGHPMHAFDRDQLRGGIVVRFAYQEESLTLLDGRTLKLSPDTLIVADEKKPLALAGIMGGEFSGISEKTTSVFLESAFFNPITIAGKARRYGLHTDASARYERGVDWQLAERACERATELLVQICGGQPGPVIVTDIPNALPALKTVHLSSVRIKQQLRISLDADHVLDILDSLGFEVTRTEKGYSCIVPSWRFDVAIEQDLIEEIARIYGYNNLPNSLPAQALSMAEISELETPQTRLKSYLVDQDIQEAITYSFVAPETQALLGDGCEGVRLSNPIASNMSEMRRSLFPGLVDAVRYNVNRQASRVRFFEMGQCFVEKEGSLDQSEHLGLALYGHADPIHYTEPRVVDFFDLKGVIEGLAQISGNESLTFATGEHPALAPGQTAEILIDGRVIGVMGRLRLGLARDLDLPKPMYLADLQLSTLLNGQVTAFKAISRYPKVSRDLAILVDRDITWKQITEIIHALNESSIQAIDLFDVYTGDIVADGKKSLAFSLSLQNQDATMDDVAIQELVDRIIQELQSRINAELRGV